MSNTVKLKELETLLSNFFTRLCLGKRAMLLEFIPWDLMKHRHSSRPNSISH